MLNSPCGAPHTMSLRLALHHASSNSALERGCWECLDHGLGWLCFDHHLLAEHHPLGGLCCWFPPSLDPGKAWDGEHARLFDLSCANLCQRTQELCDDTLLQLATGCKSICNGTLGHGPCRSCFHSTLSHGDACGG